MNLGTLRSFLRNLSPFCPRYLIRTPAGRGDARPCSSPAAATKPPSTGRARPLGRLFPWRRASARHLLSVTRAHPSVVGMAVSRASAFPKRRPAKSNQIIADGARWRRKSSMTALIGGSRILIGQAFAQQFECAPFEVRFRCCRRRLRIGFALGNCGWFGKSAGGSGGWGIAALHGAFNARPPRFENRQARQRAGGRASEAAQDEPRWGIEGLTSRRA